MAAGKRLTADALAEALVERTGHAFADRQRLQRALTHASARSTHAGVDYERFEFLGDRVLGLVVADMLLAAFPDAAEGELSLRLNALVNAEALSDIAEEIGLPELIRAGSDVRNLEGRKRTNLRADALESLIAVLYLDGGLEAARAFIHRYWPDYVLIGREGPDHDPLFTVSVKVGAFAPATGSGRSKREAEQAAATTLLLREGVWSAA